MDKQGVKTTQKGVCGACTKPIVGQVSSKKLVQNLRARGLKLLVWIWILRGVPKKDCPPPHCKLHFLYNVFSR